MKHDLLQYLENIFRTSNSPDEIFDAVDTAIKQKICDTELYKILLANPSLSKDELIMFSEKICKEFPEITFPIYMWLGGIFECRPSDYNALENSFYYYQKSFLTKPSDDSPILAAMNLYNYEIDLPLNTHILKLANNSIDSLDSKHRVFSKLAEHFGKTGDENLKHKYAAMAEKEIRNRNQ